MNPKLIRIAERQRTQPDHASSPLQELLGEDVQFSDLEDLYQQLRERGMSPDQIIERLGGFEGVQALMGDPPSDSARRAASFLIAEAGYDSSAYAG